MAKQSIRLVISSLFDKTGITSASRGIASLMLNAKKMGASMSAAFKGVFHNLMNIKAGLDMAVTAFKSFIGMLSSGIQFEKMTTSFKVFLGTMEEAKEHMRDMQELGRTPPFGTEEFANASREMLKMSNGMLGFAEDLKTVGDIAAATGRDVASVGRAFGLAYQVIADGQNFGRAGQQLYMMGILTKAQVAELDALSKAGVENIEVWEKFIEMTHRYDGAMEDTEKTAWGLSEAIKSELGVATNEVSMALLEELKPALEMVLDALREFIDTGSASVWAEAIVENFRKVVEAAKMTSDAVGWVWDHSGMSDLYHTASGIVAGVGGGAARFVAGMAEGESMGDAWHNANAYSNEVSADHFAKGYYTRQLAETEGIREAIKRQEEEEAYQAERIEEIKEEAAKRRQEREAKAAEKAAQHKAKIEEDLKKRQKEREEREAKKLAEKEAEKRRREEEKAAQKAAREAEKLKAQQERERLKAEAQAERDRQNAQRKAYREEMEMLRGHYDFAVSHIDEEKQAVEDTISRLKAAGAENPMSMASGLDQKSDAKSARQKEIDEARFNKARVGLEEKMKNLGVNIDSKDLDEKIESLGRLSNLEKATLERLRLDSAKTQKEVLEEKKVGLLGDLDKKLKDIQEKMENVGL